VLRPEADPSGEELYATPIGEFRLSRHVLADGAAARPLPATGPQILLCASGEVSLRGAQGELPLQRGESAFVPAGEEVVLGGDGTVFRATVTA
jgi:mannose-6-phosphate isomerase